MKNQCHISRNQIAAMNQHYKYYSIDYFLDCQQKLGIQNIELWMSMPHFALDTHGFDNCKKLLHKALSRDQRIISVTAPSCDFQYQYGMPVKEYRQQCISYFSNGVLAAAELEAPMMTVNSGWGYWGQAVEEGLENTKEILFQVAKKAEQESIQLVMETLTEAESQLITNRNRLKAFVEDLDMKSLKIMVDTVAMMDAGETLEDWFDTFGQDILHMHFVDGKKSWDHYAWGDGTYSLENFITLINQYGYNGYLSQELATEAYLQDPFSADKRNMGRLSSYFRD